MEDKLRDELYVAQNVLLFLLQEVLLVLRRLEFREFIDFEVKGMLDSVDEEVFERIVLLSLLVLLFRLLALEFEFATFVL